MSNIYELKLGGTQGNKNFFENVFHYQLSEGGTHSSWDYAGALLSAWVGGLENLFIAMLGTDVDVNLLSAKRVTGPGGPTATQAISDSGTSGNLSGSVIVAADVAWYPGGDANKVGHTYVSGVPGVAIIEDNWQDPFPTSVNTWITQMLIEITLTGDRGTAIFGTYSKKTHNFNRATFGELRPKASAFNKRTLPVT